MGRSRYLQYLHHRSSDQGPGRIVKEFATLEAIKRTVLTQACRANRLPCPRSAPAIDNWNAGRDRWKRFLPQERTRVRLRTPIDGSDYVNADRYSPADTLPVCTAAAATRSYLLTQAPTPNSMAAFWEMVWEQEVQLIVMLTPLRENGHLKAHSYWSTDGGAAYGPFRIVSVVEQASDALRNSTDASRDPGDEQPAWITRTITVERQPGMAGASERRTVRQLQFLAWPDSDIPPLSLFLQFFQSYVSIASTLDPSKPLVVHCSGKSLSQNGHLLPHHLVNVVVTA